MGNSLVVQWLEIHAFTDECEGSIPRQGTKIPQAMRCSQKNKKQNKGGNNPLCNFSIRIGEGNGTPLQYFCLEIPWTGEPGGLPSMGSHRVRHNWAPSLSLFTFMRWRRTWQPTPVFLPGESQGQGSLVGCCLWGHTESDTTEAT